MASGQLAVNRTKRALHRDVRTARSGKRIRDDILREQRQQLTHKREPGRHALQTAQHSVRLDWSQNASTGKNTQLTGPPMYAGTHPTLVLYRPTIRAINAVHLLG